MDDNPSKAYSLLKRLGARPGDVTDSSAFELTTPADKQLLPQQAADSIADHFAAVSNEFVPFHLSRLPLRVQAALQDSTQVSSIPNISEMEIWDTINKSRGGESVFLGDLPNFLSKEFSAELSAPLSKIFNNILKTGEWPSG